jgi:uncharacterized protein (DUF433 family)
MEINFSDCIVSNSKVMAGKPVIRGTRVPMGMILKMLVQEIPEEELKRQLDQQE